MEPSALTVVHDYCAFLGEHGAGCLSAYISVWEQIQQQTYTISNSRYVMTSSSTYRGAGTDNSLSKTEFGRCSVQ